jgi:3',5'-cyclic AMP phosphodiesterase CpdA
MTYILHLSDLHFGSDHGFLMPGQAPIPGNIERDIADTIADDLKSQNVEDVAAVIISGDLMTHAHWVDHGEGAYKILTKMCERINISPAKVFIIPGNHDYE